MAEFLTADEYIAGLEPNRREMVSAIRDTVNENLDPGFEEMIDFGMIAWCVPLECYLETYNGRPLTYAALASQKRYASIYLMGIYADPGAARWFEAAYEETGLKPNMGKSCVRFTRLENVPLDLIGETVRLYSVDSYLSMIERARRA